MTIDINKMHDMNEVLKDERARELFMLSQQCFLLGTILENLLEIKRLISSNEYRSAEKNINELVDTIVTETHKIHELGVI